MNKKSCLSTPQAVFARGLVSLFLLLPAWLSPQGALAQFGGDAFSAGDSGTKGRSTPITGSQYETIYISTAPMLQGATNGTIGPPLGDATLIYGVNTAGLLTGDVFSPYAPPSQDEVSVPIAPRPIVVAPEQITVAPEQITAASPPEPSIPSEVVREDPRALDLPDELSDQARNTYCRVIVESGSKGQASRMTAHSLLQLGIAYANTGQSKEAMERLKLAARRNPACDVCHYNLGTIYSNQGSYVNALKEYNKALTIRPSQRAYYHLGLTYAIIGLQPMALKTLDKAVALNPDDRKARFERGVCKLNLGLAGDALKDFEMVLDSRYPRASWLCQRGIAHSKLGNYEQALADFDLTLKMDDRPRYYNERGKVFLKLTEYDAALYDFNEALHRNSSFAEAYQNRAEVYSHIGRSGPAVDDLLMANRLAGIK